MVRGYEKTWPGISSLRNMAHMLGARMPQVLKGVRLADLTPLGPSGDTAAQVAFAVAAEMALTLEDVVMRRTAIGQFGKPAAPILESVASQMAARLGWSEEKKAREIASLDPIYRTAP
jgi:glycerol-3-phosphate dehydrogenase